MGSIETGTVNAEIFQPRGLVRFWTNLFFENSWGPVEEG